MLLRRAASRAHGGRRAEPTRSRPATPAARCGQREGQERGRQGLAEQRRGDGPGPRAAAAAAGAAAQRPYVAGPAGHRRACRAHDEDDVHGHALHAQRVGHRRRLLGRDQDRSVLGALDLPQPLQEQGHTKTVACTSTARSSRASRRSPPRATRSSPPSCPTAPSASRSSPSTRRATARRCRRPRRSRRRSRRSITEHDARAAAGLQRDAAPAHALAARVRGREVEALGDDTQDLGHLHRARRPRPGSGARRRRTGSTRRIPVRAPRASAAVARRARRGRGPRGGGRGRCTAPRAPRPAARGRRRAAARRACAGRRSGRAGCAGSP